MEENRNVAEEAQKIQEPSPQIQPVEQEKSNVEETPEQINWRKFRQKREEERKIAEKRIAEERERAEKAAAEAKALKEAIDAIISRESTSNHSENSDSDEDRIAKLVSQEVSRIEQERERKRIEQESREWPQKLAREFQDFSKVCTEENLDYLEYHHPEIAAPFKHLPDGYEKWKNIYAVVKKMIPNPVSLSDERRMEKNLSKPRSIATPGLPSTGDVAPHLLDDDKKRNNWLRMQKVMKGI